VPTYAISVVIGSGGFGEFGELGQLLAYCASRFPKTSYGKHINFRGALVERIPS